MVRTTNFIIFLEIEKQSDGILVGFGVQDRALLEIISEEAEPSALLLFQLPADIATVETQLEDVPKNMVPYTDAEENVYDFAFGLNRSCTIIDEPVSNYK